MDADLGGSYVGAGAGLVGNRTGASLWCMWRGMVGRLVGVCALRYNAGCLGWISRVRRETLRSGEEVIFWQGGAESR